MKFKRLCAWAAVAVVLLPFGSPAFAEGIHDYVHNGSGVSLTGVPETGNVLTISAPAGSTCQMLRSGSAIPGATSCTSYTVVPADVTAGAGALSLQVKTTGITAYATLTIGGSCATTGTVGTAYSCSGVAASGGATPYTYVLSGAWPSWASINASTGAVSGTPTTAASYPSLSVAAIDSIGGSASIATFTLAVSAVGSLKLDFSQAPNSQYIPVVF